MRDSEARKERAEYAESHAKKISFALAVRMSPAFAN